MQVVGATYDLRQNKALGRLVSSASFHLIFSYYYPPGGEVAKITLKRYGGIDYEWGIKSASTDFVRRLIATFIFA